MLRVEQHTHEYEYRVRVIRLLLFTFGCESPLGMLVSSNRDHFGAIAESASQHLMQLPVRMEEPMAIATMLQLELLGRFGFGVELRVTAVLGCNERWGERHADEAVILVVQLLVASEQRLKLVLVQQLYRALCFILQLLGSTVIVRRAELVRQSAPTNDGRHVD